MTESKLTISWEKEGHIFCDFRFSSSFQKIDMILLTRPEGGLIGLISLIKNTGSYEIVVVLVFRVSEKHAPSRDTVQICCTGYSPG